MEITQDYVKSLFDYDKESGDLFWKISPSKNVKIGTKAGCLRKKDNYISVGINKRLYFAHVIIWLWMTGEFNKFQIDHKDGKSNKWINLRKSDSNTNAYNQKIAKNNTSGAKGIDWHNESWRVRIQYEGKRILIGYYDILNDAIKAYNKAALKYHGEFARLNEEL